MNKKNKILFPLKTVIPDNRKAIIRNKPYGENVTSSKQAACKLVANKHSLKIIQLSDRQSTTFLPQEEVN